MRLLVVGGAGYVGRPIADAPMTTRGRAAAARVLATPEASALPGTPPTVVPPASSTRRTATC